MRLTDIWKKHILVEGEACAKALDKREFDMLKE